MYAELEEVQRGLTGLILSFCLFQYNSRSCIERERQGKLGRYNNIKSLERHGRYWLQTCSLHPHLLSVILFSRDMTLLAGRSLPQALCDIVDLMCLCEI